MAWTAPRTWTTGELVTAAIQNTHVRDNLLFVGQLIGGTRSEVVALGGFFIMTGSPLLIKGTTSLRWQFDDGATEEIISQFVVPEDYSADGVFRLYYSMDTADSGEVRWFVAIAAKAEGEDLNVAGSTDIADDTVQGTAVNVGVVDITTSETLAAGDVMNVLVGRSGAHANDTATGDAFLHAVAFRYTPLF